MSDPNSRKGHGYATDAILAWLAERYAKHDPALQQAFDAPEINDVPAIQVSPLEGKVLQWLLRLNRSKRVVEIGTLAGYSAIWMARALPSNGHLWSLEADEKHADIARAAIATAGLERKVTVIVGEALKTLPTIVDSGPFCAIFVDADKGGYQAYARWATANLRQGGLLIGDNVFLFGNLLAESASAEAMRGFHEELAQYYDACCLATPDGLAVGIKR